MIREATYKTIAPHTNERAYNEILAISSNDDSLNEAFKLHHNSTIFSLMKKIGGDVQGCVNALIDGNEEKAKKFLIKLARKDIFRFFIMLDAATVHIFAHVLHTIDVITGWELYEEVKRFFSEASKNVEELLDILSNIADDIEKVYTKKESKKILQHVSTLRHHLERN